ncbi:hypothetical protein ACFQV2_26250 [Actinokineospora soli]|uniref:Uncharacterized protein n=1 Tax=Actinokineospora soli TaxID=1048753 RepID=A0ABW2TRJ5_9PSEU
MPAIVVLSADSTVTAPIVAALRGQDHDVRAVAVHALPRSRCCGARRPTRRSPRSSTPSRPRTRWC